MKLKNLKSSHFCQNNNIYLVLTICSVLFSPLSITWLDSLMLRGFEPCLGVVGLNFSQTNIYADFHGPIVFIELFRYILKLILNYYFKFERNLSWILLPQELP